MPRAARQLARRDGERDFGAGGEQRDLARAVGLLEHIGAAGRAVLAAVAAQRRHRLARQRQHRGRARAASASSQHSAVSTASAGRNTREIRNGAQAARCSTG